MMTLYKIFLTAMCSNLDVISFIQNECFQLCVVAADTARTHVMMITSSIQQKHTTQQHKTQSEDARKHELTAPSHEYMNEPLMTYPC